MSQLSELGGYRVIGRLAVGGMAEVYQAEALPHTKKTSGEPEAVALKRLLPAYRGDAAFIQSFIDEARLTVRLRHANIVRTFRCFKAGDDYLMVQELVSGQTLAFMQEAFAKSGGAMPPAASVYIVSCLLRALDYVHRAKVGDGGASIVHRDVSPANVLLSVAGEVKLTDFGVAEVEGLMKGATGALRGTVAYMSPEQVLGQPVDHRSDLFSAGIILWELLANRRLFSGQAELEIMQQVREARVPCLSTLDSSLPEPAVQIARKALFADRRLRFQSAAEFLRALDVLAHRQGWPTTVEALKPMLEGG